MPSALKPAYVLSVIILVLAAAAAGAGLLLPELYRDNRLVTAGWLGNDLVTILIAVPLMTAALLLSARGSERARLVWMGMLAYMLYNWAFYLFGARFNELFLAYAALTALSGMALVLGVRASGAEAIGARFKEFKGRKVVAGFMAFIALGLTAVYSVMSVGFIFSGALPPIVLATDHPTSVVFALDLCLVVPWFALGSVLLWSRKPWGPILGVVMNIKGATYMAALSAATLSAVKAGATDDISQIWVWGMLGLGSLAAAAALLRALAPSGPAVETGDM